MPANTSAWTRFVSGATKARFLDDIITHSQGILENALDAEHYFAPESASSLSGGLHREGSARIYSGTTWDTPNSVDSRGKLFYRTDTGTLHYFAASSVSTIGTGSFGFERGILSSMTFSPHESKRIVWTSDAAGSFDNGGYFGTVNAQSVTIPAGLGGVYLFTAGVGFSAVGDANAEATLMIREGTTVIAAQSSSLSTLGAAVIPGLSVSVLRNASVGSSYRVDLVSSATLTISSGACRFSGRYLGGTGS